MKKGYRQLIINPGSTSTKLAVFSEVFRQLSEEAVLFQGFRMEGMRSIWHFIMPWREISVRLMRLIWAG